MKLDPVSLIRVVDVLCLAEYSESLGSEEESGKDWDELEDEARKGLYLQLIPHQSSSWTCETELG